MQARTHFIGPGSQFMAGRAFLESALAARRVAVGLRGYGEKRG
jgi:hypothetical protein